MSKDGSSNLSAIPALSWNSVHVCSVAQLCLSLCHPVDGSPPGSSVHGILRARKLEWVAIFFSRESSRPTDPTCISCVSWIGGVFFTTEPYGKSHSQGYQSTFRNKRISFTCVWSDYLSSLLCLCFIIHWKWKWKVKVKSLSHDRHFLTPWTAAYQSPLSMGVSRQEY